MNFDNIRLVKNGKHVKIYNKSLEKIYFSLDLETIFGNENNDNVNYINWTIENELEELLSNVEESFCQYMRETFNINSEWTWKTSIRIHDGITLIRTTNTTNIKVIKNKKYTISINLDSVWTNKKTKTFGLIWTC